MGETPKPEGRKSTKMESGQPKDRVARPKQY